MDILIIITSLLVYFFPASSHCIGCYVCTNANGTSDDCETLNNTKRNEEFYKPTCMAGRKKWLGIHEGFEFKNSLFPASACIKVSGHYVNETSKKLMVRSCVLDSGSLTDETEIIRQSMCGHFLFEERLVKGCIKTCDDVDGCNRSSLTQEMSLPLLLTVCIFISYSYN